MKALLFVAAISLSGMAIAQEAAPPAPTNPTDTSPPANMPMPMPPASDPAAAVPPEAPAPAEATAPAPDATKTYPKCSRSVRDNCVNPGGK